MDDAAAVAAETQAEPPTLFDTAPNWRRGQGHAPGPGEIVRGTRHHPVAVPDSSLKVLSLYSGAGGLDQGFVEDGAEIVFANEWDPHACASYRANIGNHIVEGDVLSTEIPDLYADVVIGGPPCQGFSVIGRMNPDDPRSKHVHHFMEVVEHIRPRAFVLENVAALGESPRWAGTRADLRARAKDLDYNAEIFVVNAADFGVPQARRRMFFIGVLDGEPVAPEPTTKGVPVTVREALGQLPAFATRGNDTICTARVIPARAPVMRPTPYRGSLLFNGSGRPLELDGTAKTLPASMGGNGTPIIDQLELDTGAKPWVVDYHRHLLEGGAPASEAPARMRRVTVEEAAALQTFPPHWDWKGPVNSRYRQIGNAVPPRLGFYVSRAVRAALAAAPAPEFASA